MKAKEVYKRKRKKRNIYVSRIPLFISKRAIEEHFSKFGAIEVVSFGQDNHPSYPKIAIIEAQSVPISSKIMSAPAPRFDDGYPIQVEKYLEGSDLEQKIENDSRRKIWVSNIDGYVTKQVVDEIFGRFGVIKYHFLNFCKNPKMRNEGYIEFYQEKAAKEAKEAGFVTLGDNKIMIKEYKSEVKRKFKEVDEHAKDTKVALLTKDGKEKENKSSFKRKKGPRERMNQFSRKPNYHALRLTATGNAPFFMKNPDQSLAPSKEKKTEGFLIDELDQKFSPLATEDAPSATQAKLKQEKKMIDKIHKKILEVEFSKHRFFPPARRSLREPSYLANAYYEFVEEVSHRWNNKRLKLYDAPYHPSNDLEGLDKNILKVSEKLHRNHLVGNLGFNRIEDEQELTL